MQISSIDVVIYTFQFVIPGYIIESMISSVIPQRRHELGEKALRCIGYSVFNLCIWYWLFVLIRKPEVSTAAFWMFSTLATLITGTITGLVLGIIKKKGWFRKLFERTGIPMERPEPTAWEYLWSDGKAHVLEVTLANDQVIRGLYSTKSFTSSDDSYHDIYLERAYTRDASTGEWVTGEPNQGIWIEPKQIRFIKLFETKED